MYTKIKEEGLSWCPETLWILFQSMVVGSRVGSIYCIIDNMNNCDSERNHFLEEFVRLADSADGILKIIVTNSDGDADRPTSGFVINVDTRESQQKDLEEFVNYEISRLIQARPSFQDFAEIIREKVLSLKSTFLITSLVFEWFHNSEAQSIPLEMEKALDHMPRSLAEIYQGGLIGNRLYPTQWNLKALFWIAHTLRPLKLEELATALAIEFENDCFRYVESSRPRCIIEDLKRAFGKFLAFHDDEMFLIYESAKDFLLQSAKSWEDNANFLSGHARVAYVCLDYLLEESWEATIPEDSDSVSLPPLEGRLYFLSYAAKYWHVHFKLAEKCELLSRKLVFSSWIESRGSCGCRLRAMKETHLTREETFRMRQSLLQSLV